MGDYRLGEPMHVYDQALLLGRVDPVLVSDDRREVNLEHFTPSDFVLNADFYVAGLVLMETCAFLCGNFNSVESISFVLSGSYDGLGTGTAQAIIRAETMMRIGAKDIRISPKPDRQPAHFAVSGVWQYGDQAIVALSEALAHERRKYAQWKARSKPSLKRRMLNLLGPRRPRT